MSDWHRSTAYSRSKVPVKPSAKPIYGELEDSGKYFRCKHCGFICNIKRDRLGDGDGRTYNDVAEEATSNFSSGDALSIVLGVTGKSVILQNGANGNPITSYRYNQKLSGSQGCPLCHSLNWK